MSAYYSDLQKHSISRFSDLKILQGSQKENEYRKIKFDHKESKCILNHQDVEVDDFLRHVVETSRRRFRQIDGRWLGYLQVWPDKDVPNLSLEEIC